jgi:(2Fe-2S) ferredoxin
MKVSDSHYPVITVCINHRANPDVPSCAARGGAEVARCLEQAVAERNLPLRIERFNCLGKCELGPNLKLSPGGNFYHGVSPESIPELLDEISASLPNTDFQGV